jgi:hypothetical protein
MPREIDVVDGHLGANTALGIGWVREQLCIAIPLPAGTGAFEVITDWQPGYKRVVESAVVFVSVAGTGVGASRDLRIIKNVATVAATGTLTLANTATGGGGPALAVTAADAEFLDGDTFTVDFAAGGTAFTGGSVNLIVSLRTRPQQLT